jgi:hypothetical protein
MVNIAMECGNEGWKTPDAAWLDMETREEREVFFVHMTFVDDDVQEELEEEDIGSFSTEE